MHSSPQKLLCLHGAIVMFTAFVAGLMIGVVATGQMEGSFADWRLAHVEPLINSILLFAVAGCLSYLKLNDKQLRIVALSLVLMAWCNTVFGFMRGLTGALGYQFDDSLANNITAAAGMLGVPLGILAFSLILYGAMKSD